MNEDIVVYGRVDCADTSRTRALLERRGAAYLFRDVSGDPDARAEAERLSGASRVPVVVFPDGAIEVEPSDEVVLEHLRAR